MVFLTPTKLFFCGEKGSKPNTYIFHLQNEYLENRNDMNEGRHCHGLINLKSTIYVFGGNVYTAEKYEITSDTWTMIEN